MTNQQLFDAIECGDVLYGLLNSSEPITLQARMEQDEILAIALMRLDADRGFRAEAVDRARRIANSDEVPGYLHPARTAVAAYMYLFFNSGYRDGLEFIREVTDRNRADFGCVRELAYDYAWRVRDLSMWEMAEGSGKSSVGAVALRTCDFVDLEAFAEQRHDTFVTSRSYPIAA